MLGKRHQRTFRNDMRILLSLFLHFYLLHLLLNSCDGNDATCTSDLKQRFIEHGERYHKMSLKKLLIKLKKRLPACVNVKGHHFEHLLK